MPGTAKPATSRAGSEMLTIRNFKSLPSIVRIWDVRFAGSPSQVSSCVPATAALITRTVREPLDLRNADCSSTTTKSKMENFSSKQAKCRPLVSPQQVRQEGRRHAPDPETRRLDQAHVDFPPALLAAG